MYVKWILILSLLLFFVFIMYRWHRGMDNLTFFSIRLLLGVFLLYIVHLFIARYGMEVSINLFSITMVSLLGLPGVLMIIFLSVVK